MTNYLFILAALLASGCDNHNRQQDPTQKICFATEEIANDSVEQEEQPERWSNLNEAYDAFISLVPNDSRTFSQILQAEIKSNKNTPHHFYIKYDKPINNYHIQGVAIFDAELSNRSHWYYRQYLEFKNLKTQKSFIINEGIRTYITYTPEIRDTIQFAYYNFLKDVDRDYTDYSNHFVFADIDFDGIEELITGSIPNVGQRGTNVLSKIYKIKNDSLIDISAHFYNPNNEGWHYPLDMIFYRLNQQTGELVNYGSGGWDSWIYIIYKFDRQTKLYKAHRFIDYDDYKIRLIVPDSKGNDTIDLCEYAPVIQEVIVRGRTIRKIQVSANEDPDVICRELIQKTSRLE